MSLLLMRSRGPVAAVGDMRVAPSANWAYMIGPQAEPDAVPAGWADVPPNVNLSAETPVDIYHGLVMELDGFVSASGTVAVTNGSNVVTGTGTSFGTAGLVEHGAVEGNPGCRIYDTAASTWRYYVLKDINVGAQTAKLAQMGGEDSNGDLVNWAGTTQSGLTIEQATLTLNSQSVRLTDSYLNQYNYYDRVYCLYQMWMRYDNCAPGSTILAHAREMADNYANTALFGDWTYDTTYGVSITPRAAAIMGMICRAIDGRPEWWPGIVKYVNANPYALWLYRHATGQANNALPVSTRDAAYSLEMVAAIAAVHPDSGVRATYQERALAMAVDPCLRSVSVMTFATSPTRIHWRLAGGNFDPDDDGFYDVGVADSPASAVGVVGGGGETASQPFLDSLMIEALIHVHRMARKNGLTADARYATIGQGIVDAVEGWWSARIGNETYDKSRGMPYFAGQDTHYRIDGFVETDPISTSNPFMTLTGRPSGYGVSDEGSTAAENSTAIERSYNLRQQMADGIGALGYAHVLDPSRGNDERMFEAVDACFRATRSIDGSSASGGDTRYSLHQYYVALAGQGKLWNQHYRHLFKGLGYIVGDSLEAFGEG